jgi:hypothetical protein
MDREMGAVRLASATADGCIRAAKKQVAIRELGLRSGKSAYF